MKRVYMIGFMGVGKTTIGKALAKRIRWRFVDTDRLIENELGMTINNVFEKMGEQWFRKYEKKVLNRTVTMQNTIISTGGGTPCFDGNIDTMLQNGLCIYLYMPVKAIFARLSQSKKPRPLINGLQGSELERYVTGLVIEREKIYSMAHHAVDALSPDILTKIYDLVYCHFGMQH